MAGHFLMSSKECATYYLEATIMNSIYTNLGIKKFYDNGFMAFVCFLR